ncbi:class I adenylate cyclase [Escherichia coli]
MALFRITNCTACQCRLKPITSNYRRGGYGFASEGIIQFFFEETQDENGFNIYILDESNRVEVYHHCEGSRGTGA